MMVTLRWILFLPAGILAGLVVSALFRFTAQAVFPETIELILCVMGQAVAIVLVGLIVAREAHCSREVGADHRDRFVWRDSVVLVLVDEVSTFCLLRHPERQIPGDPLDCLAALCPHQAQFAFHPPKHERGGSP